MSSSSYEAPPRRSLKGIASVARSYGRTLTAAGYDVEIRLDGVAAIEAVRTGPLDVVLSDIDMPRLGGVALLERIRSHDLDIPVILITGSPSLETAVAAVQHGALRYRAKPVDAQQLRSVTADAVRLHRLARAKRSALDLAGGVDRLVGDRAGLIASFGRALDTLWIAYQPIVSWSQPRHGPTRDCAPRRIRASRPGAPERRHAPSRSDGGRTGRRREGSWQGPPPRRPPDQSR
jgi:CheY-like chemotaxis protein